MDIIKCIRYDEEFAKTLSGKLLIELITLDEPIPDNLSSILRRNNISYRKERSEFLDNHWYIVKQMYINRGKLDKFDNMTDIINYRTDENIEFIIKHLQFKPLIDHIEYYDGDNEDLDTIKIVPIDEYLAELQEAKTLN